MNSVKDTYDPDFFRDKKLCLLCIVMLLIVLCPMAVYGAEAEVPGPDLYATFWSLMPPIVAISLALNTYSYLCMVT